MFNIRGMRLIALLALLQLGMASAPPVHYQTLGHEVYQRGNGQYAEYTIYDQDGQLVARGNFLGFIQWKKMTLLKLIENPHTEHSMRESYKLQYQELDSNLRTANILNSVNSEIQRHERNQRIRKDLTL